jgi:hypothetical protein
MFKDKTIIADQPGTFHVRDLQGSRVVRGVSNLRIRSNTYQETQWVFLPLAS